MVISINVESPPNFILELLKIMMPGLIGLIPFFYYVLSEKKRKENDKKDMILNQLYNFTQDYYLLTLNYSFSVNKETKEKDKIKDSIYKNRINFRNILLKSKKYLKPQDYHELNVLKDLLLNLDQNILCKFAGKDEIYDSKYDIVLNTYNKIIDILNDYI